MNDAIKIARAVFDALSEEDQESLYTWMGKKLVEPPPPVYKPTSGVPKWWLEKLESGHMLPDAGWPSMLIIGALCDDFIESLKRDHLTRRGNEGAMGRFLKSVGAVDGKPSSIKVPGGRRRSYHLHCLDDCRASFAEQYGPQAWSAQEGAEGAEGCPDAD